MNTKEIELTVVDFIAFLELPQDVRIIQKGNILYTGSIARIPPVILNEKIIRISIVFCTERLNDKVKYLRGHGFFLEQGYNEDAAILRIEIE